jgi:hypothetical protein
MGFALVFYTLFLTGVCGVVWLFTRMLFKGIPLVLISVSLAVVITILLFASGMAASDWNWAFTVPFIVIGSLITLVWSLILRKRAA